MLVHYENIPNPYTEILFLTVKIENFIGKKDIFDQNIDMGTGTYKLFFEKKSVPLYTPVSPCKSWVERGKHFTSMLS